MSEEQTTQQQVEPPWPPIEHTVTDVLALANAQIDRGREHVADVLVAAARKLREHARQFHPMGLPWFPRPSEPEWSDDDDDWQVDCQPTPLSADRPNVLMGGYIIDELTGPRARWFALVGPQIVGPIACTLTGVANNLRGGTRIDEPALADGDVLEQLVALAVTILHEEDPDDDL